MQDLQAGDTVRVEFTIGGVPWKDKYFNKLRAWKVETKSYAQKSQAAAPRKEDVDFLDANQPEEDDSLPF
jgi:hypothetical protein